MFQVPRDMVDVPVPSNARSVWGSVYRGKINSWYTANRNRTDLWPGKTASARGFNSLKALLGELYGLDIRYYALVNFQGFRKVVNAMGGVEHQRPDPRRREPVPGGTGRADPDLHPRRTPAHDRRRGAPLRAVAPPCAGRRLRPRPAPAAGAAQPARADERPGDHRQPAGARGRAQGLGQDRHQDQGPAEAARARRGRRHQEHPLVRVLAVLLRDRGPRARRAATSSRPTSRGSGRPSTRRSRSRRSCSPGASASSPRARACGSSTAPGAAGSRHRRPSSSSTRGSTPRRRGGRSTHRPAKTKIVVYNGKETEDLPETIKYLERRFDTTVTTATDPERGVDIVITLGKDAPNLDIEAVG